jgi:hypothetical protein
MIENNKVLNPVTFYCLIPSSFQEKYDLVMEKVKLPNYQLMPFNVFGIDTNRTSLTFQTQMFY